MAQFLQIHQVEILISVLAGLVTGVVSGALTSYLVTRYFRRKDERISIIELAKDLAHDCHTLLDLTNTFITQIALRKYHSYQVVQELARLDGETKRRTRNQRTMEISLREVPKETLERLCVAIQTKKIDRQFKVKHSAVLGQLISKMDAVVNSADGLCQEFSTVVDFPQYVCNVEHLRDLNYEEFIERLEKDECEAYERIPVGRDELRRALLDLVSAVGKRL